MEGPLLPINQAADAILLAFRHVVPLQLLVPARHLLRLSDVEALGVQQLFQVDLAEGGSDDLGLGVQLLQNTLQVLGIRLGHQIHLGLGRGRDPGNAEFNDL